jgi:hypothetical protein
MTYSLSASQVQGDIKMTYQKTWVLLLPSPGRAGDSPSLNKAILPRPMHMFCLDSSTQNARTKIFWKHRLPITTPS